MKEASAPLGVVEAASVCVAAFLVGGIPFSQLLARRRGIDLRTVGSRTVSGTALYKVAGFGPLAVAGLLDIGKGAVGPALAGGTGHPAAAAAAAGLAVAGHNWSPYLRGSGGRGVSPAIGALAVVAWPGSLLLLGGLGFGRLVRATGLVTFLAMVALVPLLGFLWGTDEALYGLAVALPMLAKRLLGNHLPRDADASLGTGRVFANRLLYDADESEARGPVVPQGHEAH